MSTAFQILRNIHGKPWLIEPAAGAELLTMWDMVRKGVKSFEEQNPYGTAPKSMQFGASNVTVAPTTWGGRREFKGFQGSEIAVIPVSGPLMKSDYCGDLGTASMRELCQMAIDTPSVQTIVLHVDSPGGTVDGTQAFANVVASAKYAGKRTVCVVDGMMCSAAYWIGSQCDEIYAGDSTCMIGSIGTMCTLYDDSKYLAEEGIVIREYYATESKDKNAAFTDAKAGDGKKLVQEMLDPLNNEFLAAVTAARGEKLNKANTLSGKVFIGPEAQQNGLIDGIKSVSQVLSTLKSSKSINMTSTELKAAHPATYAEILAEGRAEGATAERSRIAAWQEWHEANPEAVKAGIESGKEITPADVKGFSEKLVAATKLKALEAESPAAIDAGTTAAAEQTDEEKEMAAIIGEIKARTVTGG